MSLSLTIQFRKKLCTQVNSFQVLIILTETLRRMKIKVRYAFKERRNTCEIACSSMLSTVVLSIGEWWLLFPDYFSVKYVGRSA